MSNAATPAHTTTHYPRVIGSDGPDRYLVAVDRDWGRILDLGTGQFYMRQLIGTILVMSGPWEPASVASDQLAGMIASAEDGEAELTPEQHTALMARIDAYAASGGRKGSTAP